MKHSKEFNFRRYLRSVVDNPLERLLLSLAFLIFLNIVGTIAYMSIEGWTFIEALYMTVITIGTVGFTEVRHLSPEGRIFTIILIYLGIGTATTAITNLVSLTLGPLLWGSLQERRMKKLISELKNHYIVCGYGRMGRQIIRDLQARGEAFVLIDVNDNIRERLLEEEIPYIFADATNDDTLIEAGIERSRGLVAALNDDASNVMTVLTARELNPNLFIVARVVRAESESKLKRAGANRVVNPYQIGGHRIALSLLRPAVHDFLDHIFHFGEDRNIDIGQIPVSAALEGKTISSSQLRDKFNISILAIRQADGQIDITPNPSTILEQGAELIIIGPPEAIYKLEREDI